LQTGIWASNATYLLNSRGSDILPLVRHQHEGYKFDNLFIVVNNNNNWCRFGSDEGKIRDSLLLCGS